MPTTDRPSRAQLHAGLCRAASASSSHAVATGFTAGWRVVGRLPETAARRWFGEVADRVHRRDGRGVRQLRDNLAAARPDLDGADLDELTREAVRSYLRYWFEVFRLPSWPLPDLVDRTRMVHEERLRTPYAEGRGVVSALPHMANWDWAGAWACGTGMPVMTVVERLQPERLFAEFVRYRASLGMRILPLTGGERPLPALVSWLSDGGYVCLLADRDLGPAPGPGRELGGGPGRGSGFGSVEVELCGRRARVPAGPAWLARRTGAALLPTTLRYVDAPAPAGAAAGAIAGVGAARPGIELTLHEEVAVGQGAAGLARAMQQVADAFTTAIREAPQDWHMMQPVFLDEEPG